MMSVMNEVGIKSFWKSKTVWMQVVTLAASFVPGVQSFLAANPVEAMAALTAVNVLVRFVTLGRISIFSGN